MSVIIIRNGVDDKRNGAYSNGNGIHNGFHKKTVKPSPEVLNIPNISEQYFAGRNENIGEYFRLDDDFIAQYANKRPNFGFNGLGELVFWRTYSRLKPDGTKETFCEMTRRVVEGCYEIQRRHCRRLHIPWDYNKALVSAYEMFQRIWDFKFTPPGRGMWMMGTPFMWERGGSALNNCAFVSTDDQIESDPAEPFCFLMDMSMLGVGVGFDTRGAGKILVNAPNAEEFVYAVPDSREGWVDSIRVLIHSYTTKSHLGTIIYDYSHIRKAGSDINGFGGKASGPGILERLHEMIRDLLDRRIGAFLSSVDIVDLMNFIGVCVVAGNVRRTAELALGAPNDVAYRQMKDNRVYSKELETHRWASNNSLLAYVGMDYDAIGEQNAINGEPGLQWLENIRDYGRTIDGRQPGIDGRAKGTNPCGEQSLESYELCCLVETFPTNHDDAEDYMRTLKFAYLYAKTVTLLPTHNLRTNQVTLRNRRIGVSQSGIIQAFAKFGRRAVLRDFCDAGYNEIRRWDSIYAEWLCVQRSIKVTSVKPSGTVSLLAGSTPGIHHPEASTYWRRVRLASDSILVKVLADAGYHIEPTANDSERTVVVKFAVSDERVRPVKEVSIWEQMANAVDYQRYWADNQVSCTVKFNKSEVGDIKRVLEAYEDQLKGISFLPLEDHGYEQAPYEPCTPEEAAEYNAKLKPVDYRPYVMEAAGSYFCDNEKCELRQ